MHTRTMAAFEVKTHFSKILEEVEMGKQVIITKNGHPVAKISPLKEKKDRQHFHNVIAQLEAFCSAHTLGDEDWKSLRDEGRK